ncbi:hypothetical protein BpHYR1_040584 [Brachionus plicatilis]|uniref:Uncharacterized protein n=1 Tax=Brachionus plicatilis TaxID=10195 RepID=A0A3M7T0U9_BRAPC|nr:hypothetical protein BpHYR1_040584 [Brachionus plicatilis]
MLFDNNHYTSTISHPISPDNSFSYLGILKDSLKYSSEKLNSLITKNLFAHELNSKDNLNVVSRLFE